MSVKQRSYRIVSSARWMRCVCWVGVPAVWIQAACLPRPATVPWGCSSPGTLKVNLDLQSFLPQMICTDVRILNVSRGCVLRF